MMVDGVPHTASLARLRPAAKALRAAVAALRPFFPLFTGRNGGQRRFAYGVRLDDLPKRDTLALLGLVAADALYIAIDTGGLIPFCVALAAALFLILACRRRAAALALVARRAGDAIEARAHLARQVGAYVLVLRATGALKPIALTSLEIA